MKVLFRFTDWPLRAKMASLFVLASFLPSAVITLVNIPGKRVGLRDQTAGMLATRGDELVQRLDEFHRTYRRANWRVSLLPNVVKFCRAAHANTAGDEQTLREFLNVWPASDPTIREAALLTPSGSVMLSTDTTSEGLDLSHRHDIAAALRGILVISDIFLESTRGSSDPTIAYSSPVLDADQKLVGVIVFSVRATALWDVMRRSNGLGGPDSSSALIDQQGIRIGNTSNPELVFHPGLRLDPALVDSLVAEGRFGKDTRRLLEDVRPFPDHFDRAVSPSPDPAMFEVFSPTTQRVNCGVARRCEMVPWTVFFITPQRNLSGVMTTLTWWEFGKAGLSISAAVMAGLWFASGLVRPVTSLSQATESIAAGDLAARVAAARGDELGRLALSFNTMAERLQRQAAELDRARDELEDRVAARTAELSQAAEQIRMSEARMGGIVNSAMDAMISVDDQQRILLFNPAAEWIFRCPSGEALGQPIDKFIPERFSGRHRQQIEAFAEAGGASYAVRPPELLNGLRSGGEEFAIEASTSQVEVAGQKIFTLILRDITERDRAETALRKNEAQLQTIVESLTEAVVVADLGGELLHFNRAALSLLGYTEVSEGHRHISKLVDTFELSDLDGTPWAVEQWPLSRILRGEVLRDLEARMQRIGGDWERYFNFGGNIAYDSQGKPLMAVVTFSDITARKRAEAARLASEGRYHALFEHAPDGIVIASQGSVYLDVNPSLCRMLGYERGELVGQHASRIIADSEIPHVGSAIGVIKAKSSYEREWLFKRKDGTHFPAEVLATLMPDGNLLGMIRDVSERRRAEAAAVQLAAIVQSTNDAVIGKTLDSVVTSWNAAAEKMFGYAAAEMVGQPIKIIIPPEHYGDEERILSKIRRGERLEHFETVRRNKNGELLEVSVTVSAIKDHDGLVIGASTVVRDVSERNRAAKEIQNLNANLERRVIERTAQLQAANDELEAFSYSVSHDLRAPLRSLDGFSLALLEDCGEMLDAEGKDHLRRIRGASQRMGHLIDDMLNLSRLTRVDMNRQPIDLSRLAREVVAELRAAEPDRGTEVVVADGLTAQGDARLIGIVLTNLLGNAWKFTAKRPDARIEFGSEIKDGQSVFFVRDNGVGFDKAFAGKMFGAFQRFHTTQEFAGTGVGLATVQRVINRHGGRVWADSAVNAGATFYFTL